VDFAGTKSLSQVCRALRTMHARRARTICEAEQQLLHIADLLGNEQFLSAVLRAAPYLHTLTLDPKHAISSGSSLRGTRAGALAQEVKHVPTLENLTLKLVEDAGGEFGARQLAALKEAPALHTISLGIPCISVLESGAQALAELKDAPSLHTLTLNLRRNAVGSIGAQALAALKDAPALHTLTLNLADAEGQAPASPTEAAPLHTIALHVQENAVEDVGVQALAALKDTPSLRTLTLNLQGNSVGAQPSEASSPRYCENVDGWVWVHCPLSWDDFDGWVWVPSMPSRDHCERWVRLRNVTLQRCGLFPLSRYSRVWARPTQTPRKTALPASCLFIY